MILRRSRRGAPHGPAAGLARNQRQGRTSNVDQKMPAGRDRRQPPPHEFLFHRAQRGETETLGGFSPRRAWPWSLSCDVAAADHGFGRNPSRGGGILPNLELHVAQTVMRRPNVPTSARSVEAEATSGAGRSSFFGPTPATRAFRHYAISHQLPNLEVWRSTAGRAQRHCGQREPPTGPFRCQRRSLSQ